MKDILNHLFEGKKLTKEQAKNTLIDIAQLRNCNNSQIASFITSFLMRSITVEELEGFREALLELCVPVPISDYGAIDLCGTGGDGKNAFNISTVTSFVVAAAGIPVAKHGNYGVSSMCGSSNVLEHLGVKFTNDVNLLRRQLDATGLCFMHAPLFHPALKNLAPIRKELGVKTFFNILGPMVNPSKPEKQIVGVFNLELVRLYAYLYEKTNCNYFILHSLDGFDEISLTSAFKLMGRNQEGIYTPEDWGFTQKKLEEIKGGETIADAAQILIDILQNKAKKPYSDVVVANAALAIHCAKPTISIEHAKEIAKEALESGKAYLTFQSFLQLM